MRYRIHRVDSEGTHQLLGEADDPALIRLMVAGEDDWQLYEHGNLAAWKGRYSDPKATDAMIGEVPDYPPEDLGSLG